MATTTNRPDRGQGRIPVNARKQLSPHLRRTMEPMTSEQARDLVSRYLKSFPSLNLASPEVYLLELALLFCGYPLWAGEAVIEQAKDSFKYPPTRSELKPLLEEQVRYLQAAAPEQTSEFAGRTYRGRPVDELTWMGVPLTARQKQQLLDREAYDNSIRSDPTRPTYEELKKKHGADFGIGKGVKETPAQTSARWATQTKSWDEIKQFYEKHPDRWHNLIKPREAGLK